MEAKIKWQGNGSFVTTSGSGHQAITDSPPEAGGNNQGARPMELMLMGLGACSSYDVVSILQKSKQEMTDCQVEVTSTRSDEVPKVFTSIHLHYIVTGKNIKEKVVQRAIDLSATKYCSASIMLSKGGVKISHDYEIKEG